VTTTPVGTTYVAWVEKVRSWLPDLLCTALDWTIDGSGSSYDQYEPRYRVLIGRRGTDDLIGVRMANTRKKAEAALAEVEVLMKHATDSEIREMFALEF
jgi:hypothetical protein